MNVRKFRITLGGIDDRRHDSRPSCGNQELCDAGQENRHITFETAGVGYLEKLKNVVSAFVQEPTTMPWGNRSLLFRDPDGNLVNFFTPLSADAVERFER